MSLARYRKKRKKRTPWWIRLLNTLMIAVFVAVAAFVLLEGYRTQLLGAMVKAIVIDPKILFLILLNVFVLGGAILFGIYHWVDWDVVRFKMKQRRYRSRLVSPDYYHNLKKFDLDEILSASAGSSPQGRLDVDHNLRQSDLVASAPGYDFGRVTQIAYKDGKLDGVFRTYLSNGNILAEVSYKEGFLDGPCVIYYPNGNMHSQKYFERGKLHGIFRAWDEDGAMFFELECKDGYQHGFDKIYRKNGTLEFEDTYEEGRKVQRKTFDDAGNLKYVQDTKLDQDYY